MWTYLLYQYTPLHNVQYGTQNRVFANMKTATRVYNFYFYPSKRLSTDQTGISLVKRLPLRSIQSPTPTLTFCYQLLLLAIVEYLSFVFFTNDALRDKQQVLAE